MVDRFEPNKSIQFIYSVRNFRTAQTVTFEVLTMAGVSKGTKNMLEIASTGTYKAQWTPTNIGTFLAVMNCPAVPFKRIVPFIVGGKPGDFRTGGGAAGLKFEPTISVSEKDEIFTLLNKISDALLLIEKDKSTVAAKAAMESNELKSQLESGMKKMSDNTDNFNNELDANFKHFFTESNLKVDNKLSNINLSVDKIQKLNIQYTNMLKLIENVNNKFNELKIKLDDNHSQLLSLDFSSLNEIENSLTSISKELEEIKIKRELNAAALDGSAN